MFGLAWSARPAISSGAVLPVAAKCSLFWMIWKNSVVSLTISKGPKTSTVPDVSSTDLGSAEQTLKASGFRVAVVYQDVTDASSDGIVLSQTPQGGTQQPPHTLITLTVGRLTTGGTTTTGTTTTTP